MYILKQQEIILILRGFYAKNELVGFFAGASGMGSKFEDLIPEQLPEGKDRQGVCQFCATVSERSFNRKFQHYFNQSPYHWMQERKAELIHEKIQTRDIAFREIARSSVSALPRTSPATARNSSVQPDPPARGEPHQKQS